MQHASTVITASTSDSGPDSPRPKKFRAPYDPNGIARRYHAPQAFGFSPTTAWREVKAGRLPAPIRVSPGIVGWTPEQVRQWRESRAAGRRTNESAPAGPRR